MKTKTKKVRKAIHRLALVGALAGAASYFLSTKKGKETQKRLVKQGKDFTKKLEKEFGVNAEQIQERLVMLAQEVQNFVAHVEQDTVPTPAPKKKKVTKKKKS